MISREAEIATCEAHFGGKSRSLFGLLAFEVSVRHPGGHDKEACALEPEVWSLVGEEICI